MPLSNYPHPTAVVQHVYERVTEYLLRSHPIRDLPLNLRPAMVMTTAAWLLLLGVLGMAPLPQLPINDKALHFFGMGFATFLIYFVIDVPDGPGRRVWYIRRAPLLITLVLAFFLGGVVSEFVQGMLPWKEFQWGDILANLLGATAFLYIAHLLHNRSRRRMEITSLYQPLSSHVYRDAQGRTHTFDSSSPYASSPATRGPGPYRHQRQGSNIWDEASEFGDNSLDDVSRELDGDGVSGGTGAGNAIGAGQERDVELGAGTKVFDIGEEDEEEELQSSEPPPTGR